MDKFDKIIDKYGGRENAMTGSEFRAYCRERKQQLNHDIEIITDKGTKIILKYDLSNGSRKGYSAYKIESDGKLTDMHKGSPCMNDDLIAYLKKNF